MSFKPLDAEQICLIIEACAKSKVEILKFQGLEVRFSPKAEPPEPHTIGLHGLVARNTEKNLPVAEMTDTQHQKLDEEALRENEQMLREQQIEELKLTDPLAYEQMLRDGEIEDVNNQFRDE